MPNMKRHHVGVFSCSACFLHPLMHAKHEKTPALVSFCALHPSTSTHACKTQKDTNIGVFSCLAPVPGRLVSGKRGLSPQLSLFSTTKRPVPSSSIYLY